MLSVAQAEAERAAPLPKPARLSDQVLVRTHDGVHCPACGLSGLFQQLRHVQQQSFVLCKSCSFWQSAFWHHQLRGRYN
jgi:hypothetical protein